MIVILLSLLIFAPFMIETLESFTQGLMSRIISG
jgi:flagellar biosynthesis protein FliQ